MTPLPAPSVSEHTAVTCGVTRRAVTILNDHNSYSIRNYCEPTVQLRVSARVVAVSYAPEACDSRTSCKPPLVAVYKPNCSLVKTGTIRMATINGPYTFSWQAWASSTKSPTVEMLTAAAQIWQQKSSNVSVMMSANRQLTSARVAPPRRFAALMSATSLLSPNGARGVRGAYHRFHYEL